MSLISAFVCKSSKQHRNLHSGVRTKSGHVIFQPAPAKSWESGQRPRTLHPHELPWARTGPLSSSLSPQKSEVPKPLRPSASTVASLDSDASLDAAILAEEEAKQEEAAKTAARIAAAAAQEGHNQSAVRLSAPKPGV